MMNQTLSEHVVVRMSADQRKQLEEVASRSKLSQRLADHIRFAIQEYIAQHSVEAQPTEATS